jgi:hypothetical protein
MFPGAGLKDAQCGFKAVSGYMADAVIGAVESDGWFFDTEMLILAKDAGYRVLEVPVR